MTNIDILHFKGCTADYPEKPENETPRQITKIEIDDNEVVHQCVDCGAFIVVKQND